jgi:methyl-accepting chemotaxis protein
LVCANVSSDNLFEAVRHRLSRSYIAKLLAAFVAAVVLLSVTGGVTYVAVAEELRTDAQHEVETLSEQQAAETIEWVATRSQTARMLSEYRVFARNDVDAVSSYLREEVDRQTDDVSGIHYVDRSEGVILASSNESMNGQFLGGDGDLPFMMGGLTDGDVDSVAMTEVYTTSEDVIAFVSPVPERPTRAVVLVVSTAAVESELQTPIDGSFSQVVAPGGVVHFDGADHADGTGATDDAVGAPYPVDDAPAVQAGLDGESGVYTAAANAALGERHLVGYAPIPGTKMAVVTHAPTNAAYGVVTLVAGGFVALSLVALFSLGAFTAVIHYRTARPLRHLAETVERLRDGELDADLSTARRDELGRVYEGVSHLRDDLRDQRRDAEAYSEQMVRAAEGDLTVRLDPDSNSEDMRTVAAAYNEMMREVAKTMRTVRAFGDDVTRRSASVADGVGEVERASEEVAESVEQISSGAREQSERLDSLTDEMDTLSASIQQVASAAAELSDLSGEAATRGEEGREAAGEAMSEMEAVEREAERTAEAIRELDARLDEISDVVEMITDVAEQTNILALNASIEASRAGEAGEGFAVVAEEVKSLAEETHDSATDIADLVEAVETRRDEVIEGVERMREQVDDGADAVAATLDSLDETVASIEATDDRTDEITDAAAAQAGAADEVTGTADEVAGIAAAATAEAENVSAAAEEQTASLSEVTQSTAELADEASELGERLDEFEVGAAEGDASTDADRRRPVEGAATTTDSEP